jgi:hypothetical protein
VNYSFWDNTFEPTPRGCALCLGLQQIKVCLHTIRPQPISTTEICFI